MKSVLLVEDDQFIRDLTSVKLSERGFAVHVAQSSEEGLEVLKREEVDVIVLDIELPGANGLSLLKDIKSDPLLKKIPVVVFSNNDEPNVKSEAEKYDVAGYYIKVSTSFDELCTHINEIVA